MGLRERILKWLTANDNAKQPGLIATRGLDVAEVAEGANAKQIRFTVTNAINGKVITVAKYKPNPHGPDWTNQLYIVAEGESLIDAITTCVAMSAIE